MHGGPRWACLLCNLIYIHSSVSKMEAVLLTQATEEQRNPHKERSYLASRSEHHWRWCAGLFNVEICRREREKESKRERERDTGQTGTWTQGLVGRKLFYQSCSELTLQPHNHTSTP